MEKKEEEEEGKRGKKRNSTEGLNFFLKMDISGA